MGKLLTGFILALIMLGIACGPAFAQMGAGLKIPAINVFVSSLISEKTRIEAGLSIQALLLSAIAVDVAGKRYFDPFEVGITLQPYVGADLAIALAAGAIFISPAVLAGVEYQIADTPFSIFLEAGLGVTFGGLGIGFAPGGQLGARFDF